MYVLFEDNTSHQYRREKIIEMANDYRAQAKRDKSDARRRQRQREAESITARVVPSLSVQAGAAQEPDAVRKRRAAAQPAGRATASRPRVSQQSMESAAAEFLAAGSAQPPPPSPGTRSKATGWSGAALIGGEPTTLTTAIALWRAAEGRVQLLENKMRTANELLELLVRSLESNGGEDEGEGEDDK